MAYTKIHAIKATVHKAITYICNPEKTEEGILISSYGCSPETAQYDFKFALSKTKQSDENKAYHLIQAFAPGEVSFEEAHRIGTELADKVLEGKYSYVVTTHIDKGHVHNHIIFCAADNIEHKKYNDCRQSYYRIRKLSDELCREHQLSVIFPNGERGKSYHEWYSEQNGHSLKRQIRKDINAAIKAASSYDEFLLLMKAKGYEIKGENFGENTPKYISFRPLSYKHFLRGSMRTLGKEYTKERIRERIEQKRKLPVLQSQENRFGHRMIDTSQKKFQCSPGLKQWAEIQNLKLAAENYRESGSLMELEQKIAIKSEAAKSAKKSLVMLEREMKQLSEIITYAEQYKDNSPYHLRYKKSKNPEAYLQKQESQLLLYGGARRMLEQYGIDLKKLNTKKFRQQYSSLSVKKTELFQTYKACEHEIHDLNKKLQNLNQYLKREIPEKQESSRKQEPEL